MKTNQFVDEKYRRDRHEPDQQHRDRRRRARANQAISFGETGNSLRRPKHFFDCAQHPRQARINLRRCPITKAVTLAPREIQRNAAIVGAVQSRAPAAIKRDDIQHRDERKNKPSTANDQPGDAVGWQQNSLRTRRLHWRYFRDRQHGASSQNQTRSMGR